MQNRRCASLGHRAVCFGRLVPRSGAVLACALALSLAAPAAWSQGSAAALDEAALVNLPSDHVSNAKGVAEPASAERATARAGGSPNVDLVSPRSDEVVPLVLKKTPAAKAAAPTGTAGTSDADVASLPVQASSTPQQAAGSATAAASGPSAAAKAAILPAAEDRDGPAK